MACDLCGSRCKGSLCATCRDMLLVDEAFENNDWDGEADDE